MGDNDETTDELPARAVKFVGPDTIEGPIFLFGSRDTDGEIFTKDTDFCLDWFGKSGRPVLYEHGMDHDLKTSVMGRQTDYDVRDEGIWQKSELNRHARYRKTVDAMIERGVIGYSAGAMPHLATKSRQTGVITRFPWVESSLTPTPAEPGNLGVHYVKSADALAHLAEVDIDVPEPLKAALVALDEWAETREDDSLPDGLKVADLIDRLSVDGPAWVKARRDWYAKSGRVLSVQTRERLMRHPASLRELADDLEGFLNETDAEKVAKSADLLSLAIATEREFARLLGVEFHPTGVTQ